MVFKLNSTKLYIESWLISLGKRKHVLTNYAPHLSLFFLPPHLFVPQLFSFNHQADNYSLLIFIKCTFIQISFYVKKHLKYFQSNNTVVQSLSLLASYSSLTSLYTSLPPHFLQVSQSLSLPHPLSFSPIPTLILTN